MTLETQIKLLQSISSKVDTWEYTEDVFDMIDEPLPVVDFIKVRHRINWLANKMLGSCSGVYLYIPPEYDEVFFLPGPADESTVNIENYPSISGLRGQMYFRIPANPLDKGEFVKNIIQLMVDSKCVRELTNEDLQHSKRVRCRIYDHVVAPGIVREICKLQSRFFTLAYSPLNNS